MQAKHIIAIGSFIAALTVLIGAFGAHQLKPLLVEYNRLDTFETAVKYQFYHAFAILICGILKFQFPTLNLSSITSFFILGILIFSGSLYVLCLTNIKWLGAITPIGGVLFIVGWILLGVKMVRI
jgi:uncharacterized membrane protein YgdD (TMEM256/DUF423 family)